MFKMFHFSFSIITLIVMFSEQCFSNSFPCKLLGDTTCGGHNDCCSNFCYRHSMWTRGQCRESGKPLKTEQITKCSFRNFLNDNNSSSSFRINDAIAIHKTLPINTLVRVFLENGKNVVVKIIEHGPFGKKNTLNLSKGVARRLGVTGETSSVSCEVLPLQQIGCVEDGDDCNTYEDCCTLKCNKVFGDTGDCASLTPEEEELASF